MKEATGELSTTAIAIVAIGLILAIFTTILLPMIRTQITMNQACNGGPGYQVTNEDNSRIVCGSASGQVGQRKWTCTYTPANGGRAQTKQCSD